VHATLIERALMACDAAIAWIGMLTNYSHAIPSAATIDGAGIRCSIFQPYLIADREERRWPIT
jgi:hypothetical protein